MSAPPERAAIRTAVPAGPSIVVIGAGPTGIGVLERLIASAPELGPAGRLQVHLIDPHPPGGGRVWRAAQPSLLWANSLAADVTVLPDPSVTVDGPVGEGTTLWQWVEAVGRHLPGDDPVGAESGTAPGAHTVTDHAEAAVQAWTVAAALGRLSAEHRAVLVECYYRGRTVSEAAAALGVPAGTVKSRVHYGLRALRLALEEMGVGS